jgi:hypothetical protein
MMTCYPTPIRKARSGRALTLALPIIHGLCLAPPALAIGAYAPGYEPDKLLLQMTDVVRVLDPNAPRYAAPLGDPTFALTGSPGTASVVVDIGKNVDLPNPAKYYAITGIGILERSDNPCQITLWGKMVDPRYASFGRKVAVFELEKCRENKLSPWLDYESVDFRTAEGKFVRSARVCSGHIPPLGFLPPQEAHSSTAWDIKGLMILPGLVSPGQEEITSQFDPRTFVRPTCLKDQHAVAWGPGWSGWSSCPDDQLVTGVRVHYTKDKSFTGLTVRCKSVRLLKPLSDPVTDAVGY